MNPLILKRYEESEDGELFIDVAQNPKNREFFRRVPVGQKKQNWINFEVETNSQLYVILEGDYKAGFCIVSKMCNYSLSFHAGIVLLEEFQDAEVEGKKYCFWAMLALCFMVFGTTPFRKMKINFLESRKDLKASLTKAGFKKEARFIKEVNHNGDYQNELQYYLLKDQFYRIYKKYGWV
jgi:hypothetical protein